MKLRQKYAAVIAAAMIAASVPTFAASTNGVSKFVTVAKDATLEGLLAPHFKLELEDKLDAGDTFYLHLENAEWVKDVEKKLSNDENFTFIRESKTELRVKATKNIRASKTAHQIPLFTVATGGEATLVVESNGTAVTNGKYAFAVTEGTKGKVTVGALKGFAESGEISTITIEEPYIGAFKSDKDQFLKLEVKSKGIELNYNKGEVLKDVLVGTKSHRDAKFSGTVLDATTIEIKIPKNSLAATQRGELELTGIQMKATKDTPYGEVTVALKGDFVEDTTLVVANHSDYGAEISIAKEYAAVAGQKLKDIEFTLTETVPNSIQGTRETEFTFPEGVTIDTVVISKSEGTQKGKAAPVVTINQDKNKNTNEFRVSSIIGDPGKSVSITFKATLEIPITFNKDIVLLMGGASLQKEKEVLVAKVETPVAVQVTPARVKVGLANQTGGAVTLTETKAGNMAKGKIFLALEESTMRYSKAPTVEVTKGDLRVDGAEVVAGGIEVTITNASREASTLVISGGEITVDRTVPDGSFYVQVGGPALSTFSADTLWNQAEAKHNDIDAVIEAGFITVGNIDAEEPTKAINTASFKIGQATYTVNGVEIAMDAVPYISNSKTMLPVRYVADALGIDPSQIVWDSGTKTVTVLADKVIQIELGKKEMIVDQVVLPMATQAEMQNNRVFVPVAEIATALGAEINWDSANKIATFN
ncbi:MAG TPA: copper amine oxidase N-terminal domain-containing protein [Epulopiscium sp.]|nr:copper amine oxidase N-terminal domain-containing protein [Candidatus Epulonipiscium sp.]